MADGDERAAPVSESGGGADLGRLGAWVLLHEFSAGESVTFAQQVESWGYGTLWLPEAFGREPMVASSWLLANTSRLRVATGIAKIYSRDAFAAVNAQYALAEQSGDRFLLGLGTSHRSLVEGLHGQEYAKPLGAMRAYLEAMRRVEYKSPPPKRKPRTVIAALGPRMLELAAKLADGAHTYNVTPDHTAGARRILGVGKLLCVEQKVLIEKDPSAAREVGRRILGYSLDMPNYRRSFLRMGFTERDLTGGGSDRLIDAIIAWGDESAIRRRLQQHWDAGADHVCIQCLPRTGLRLSGEDMRTFELLAPKMERGRCGHSAL